MNNSIELIQESTEDSSSFPEGITQKYLLYWKILTDLCHFWPQPYSQYGDL